MLKRSEDAPAAPSSPPDILALTASTSDTDLLGFIQRGNGEAMGRLFDRHSKYVYSIALSILTDTERAEDVLQEIFMQIWRLPSDFIHVGSYLCGCLALITRNRAIDVLRDRRPNECEEDLPTFSDASGRSASAAMSAHAQSARLELSRRDRAVLEMTFFGGCTHTEIAATTSQPAGVVKTMVRNSLLALRKSCESSKIYPDELV